MPIQAPSWTDFLFCPICCNEFAVSQRLPISLGCGHTICRQCLATLHNRQCPFDQTSITTDVDNLPINNALLQLVSTNTSANSNNHNPNPNANDNSNNNSAAGEGAAGTDAEANASARRTPPSVRQLNPEDLKCYNLANKCIESLALYLKSLFTNNGNFGSPLSRPMQRKLVSLVNTQLMEREGRERVLRAARSLGERTVTELILQHQNPLQLSSNLWAAVRSRGCQFLGPAMQEEILKLVLQALEDGTAYSRKRLVMYVVQRLEPRFPQASKTSIGHVVQLLYRASCFKVSKREGDSSLMQLKEEFRTYDALRREHDAQIVQIATEAGLRIAPDQWSSLLYGDTVHKSHMQSIIDKLQTPSSFAQSVQELVIALQRTGDPANLSGLRTHLKHLAGIDPSLESPPSSWQDVAKALESVHEVVVGLVEFVQHHGNRKLQECTTGQTSTSTKYKISLCRDLTVRRNCPRGSSCTFAHSEEELEKYRAKNRKNNTKAGSGASHAGVGPITGSGCGNNGNNGKIDFPSHTHSHSHGLTHHNSHPLVMLHPGSDNSAPASTATSPLRFDGSQSMHNKLPRGSYGDATTSLQVHGPPGSHHHMRSLHHSPIPPNSGQPIPVPSNVHRYDPSFGTPLNYPITTSGLPPRMPQGLSNINSSPMAMRNAGSGVLPSRNFPNTLQPPASHPALPSNTPTNNPPKYLNNNNVSASLGSPLSSKSLYNALTPEFYNTPLMSAHTRSPSLFSNNQQTNSSGASGNNGGVNGKNTADLKSNIGPSEKLRLAQMSGMWDQQQRQRPIGSPSTAGDILSGVAGIGGLGTHQSTTLYPSNDTVSIFGKKVNNVNMNLNKTLNGLSIGDQYMFKNDYGVGSVLPTLNNMSNNKDSLICGDLPNQQSFWNAHNSNVIGSGSNFGDSTAERNTIAHNMSINASPGPFRDRDSFVRSDSILDDDATTFEVPATSASMGSKFGPICPMYKGHSSSATEVSHTNTYLDSWSSGDIRNLSANKEHSLLDRNVSGDINYSVFSNDTENSLASQFRQQQQQHHRQLQSTQQQQTHRPSAFDSFNGMQNTLLSDLSFNHSNMIRDRDRGCGTAINDSVNFELGYNAFQNMLSGADGNANMDINKGSSMWGGSGVKSTDAHFWHDSLSSAAAKTKELQIQRQHSQQQLLIINNKGLNNEENSIDSNRMRDIEQELSEIVDKSWSNADDSGVKL